MLKKQQMNSCPLGAYTCTQQTPHALAHTHTHEHVCVLICEKVISALGKRVFEMGSPEVGGREGCPGQVGLIN